MKTVIALTLHIELETPVNLHDGLRGARALSLQFINSTFSHWGVKVVQR